MAHYENLNEANRRELAKQKEKYGEELKKLGRNPNWVVAKAEWDDLYEVRITSYHPDLELFMEGHIQLLAPVSPTELNPFRLEINPGKPPDDKFAGKAHNIVWQHLNQYRQQQERLKEKQKR